MIAASTRTGILDASASLGGSPGQASSTLGLGLVFRCLQMHVMRSPEADNAANPCVLSPVGPCSRGGQSLLTVGYLTWLRHLWLTVTCAPSLLVAESDARLMNECLGGLGGLGGVNRSGVNHLRESLGGVNHSGANRLRESLGGVNHFRSSARGVGCVGVDHVGVRRRRSDLRGLGGLGGVDHFRSSARGVTIKGCQGLAIAGGKVPSA